MVDLVNAVAGMRMKAEYGACLSYTCKALKGENMDDTKWKVDRLDWQAVAEDILEEEALKE